MKKITFSQAPNGELKFSIIANIIFTENTGKSTSPESSIGTVNCSRKLGQAKVGINTNLSNGNLFIEDHMCVVDDTDWFLSLGMVYNSQAQPNWRINIGRSIANVTNTALTLTLDDGAVVSFVSTDGVLYTAQTPLGNYEITKAPDGSFTLVHPGSGEVSNFDSSHLEQSRHDALGHTINFAYDAGSQLKSIQLPSKRTIQWAKDGPTTTVSLYDNQQVKQQDLLSYTFNARNQLQTTTIAINPSNNYEVNYQYNPDNTLQSISQTDKTSVNFQYNNFSGKSVVSAVQDGEGRTTTFTYTNTTRTWLTGADNLNKVTATIDAENRMSQLSLPVLKTNSDGTHTIAQENTNYTYVPGGSVASITYADTVSEQYTYDKKTGYIATATNGLGHVTTSTYDQTSGVKNTSTRTATVAGSAKTVTSYDVYDDKRVLRYHISAKGKVTHFEYSDSQQLSGVRVQLGSTYNMQGLSPTALPVVSQLDTWWSAQDISQATYRSLSHNGFGQLQQETEYSEVNADGAGKVTDAMKQASRTSIDPQGRWRTKTDRQSASVVGTTSRTIDGLAREIKRIDALNRNTTVNYDDAGQSVATILPSGLTETVSWDQSGLTQVYAESDALISRQYAYQRDDRGCIIHTFTPIGARLTNYGPAGRIVQATDEQGNVAEFDYDCRHHLITERKLPNADNTVDKPHEKSVLIDAAGNPVYIIDEAGYVTKLLYDASDKNIGQIVYATLLPAGTARVVSSGNVLTGLTVSADDRLTVDYLDEDGHLLGTHDEAGFVRVYARSLNGWVLSDAHFKDPQARAATWQAILTSIAKSDKDETTYQRDLRGLIISELDPENQLTQYTRLGNGKWSKMLACVSNSPGAGDRVLTRDYDPYNNLSDEVDKTRAVQNHWEYDGHNEISLETVADQQSGEVVRQENKTRDAWGNVVLDTGPRAQEQKTTVMDPITGLKMQFIDALGGRTICYFDLAKNPMLTINPDGYAVLTTFDEFGNAVSVRDIAQKINDADRGRFMGGLITTQILALLENYKNDALDSVSSKSFDPRGLPQLETDPEQYQTKRTWNAFRENIQTDEDLDHTGTVRTIKTELVVYPSSSPGLTRTTTKDPAGLNYITQETLNYQRKVAKRIHPDTSEEDFTYDSQKNCMQRDDKALNASESWTFDRWRRQLSHINLLGKKTTTAFDDTKREKTVTTPMGRQIVAVLDALSNEVSATNAAGNTSKTTFNPAGDKISDIDALSQATSYDRAPNGWLQKSNFPGGLSHQQVLSAAGAITGQAQLADHSISDAYENDMHGKEVSHTDPLGNQTQIIRDRCSRLLMSQLTMPDLVSIQSSEYNGVGDLILSTTKDTTQTFVKSVQRDALSRNIGYTLDPNVPLNPNGQNLQTIHKLDSNNRVVEITVKNQDTTGKDQTRWEIYNLASQLCYAVSAMGIVTEYRYDAMHKISECLYQKPIDITALPATPKPSDIAAKITKDPNGDDTTVYSFYNDDGQLWYQTTGLGVVSESLYDKAGRYQGVKQYYNKIDVTQIKAGDATTVTPLLQAAPLKDRASIKVFDAAGRLKYVIGKKGQVTEHVLDAAGNAVTVIEYAKPLDLTQTITWEEASITALIDPSDINNRTKHQVFDGFNRLRYVIDEKLYVFGYEYDDAMNQIDVYAFQTALDSLPATLNVATLDGLVNKTDPSTRHTNRTYDPLKRKIAEVDALGNSQQWAYNALDHLLSYTDQLNNYWVYGDDSVGRQQTTVSPETDIFSTIILPDNPEKLLLQVQQRDALVTSKKHDSFNNITNITHGTLSDPNGRSIDLTYDQDNRCVGTSATVSLDDASVEPAKIGDKVTTKKQISTKFVLNSAGKQLVKVDESGNPWFKIYDADQKLIYEVHPLGNIRKFVRNSFGEAESIIHYNNLVKLPNALSTYATTGITIAQVEAAGVITTDSVNDRQIDVEYNQDSIKTKTTLPVDLMSWVEGEEIKWDITTGPTTVIDVNTFNEIVAKRALIYGGSTPAWAQTQYWLDERGDKVAEVDPDGYVKLYQLDHDGKPLQFYSSAYQFDPTNLPDDYTDLFNLVQKNASQDDAVYQFGRDALGNMITKKLMTETVTDLTFSPPASGSDQRPRAIPQNSTKDLLWQFKYDPRHNKLTETISPSGAVNQQSYDELARRGVKHSTPFNSDASSGKIYSPNEQVAYNIFSEPVAHISTYDLQQNGVPFYGPNPANISLMLRDERGLTPAVQDPAGNLRHMSFTATRHPARHFQWVSRWQQDGTDPRKFTTVKQVTQTKLIYDVNARKSEQHVIDYDPSNVTSTYWQHNNFDEVVGIGPDGKTWPLVYRYSNAGRVFFETKNHGIPQVHGYNGKGEETVLLRSATTQLAPLAVDQASVETLLGQVGDPNETTFLQRTALERTARGDVTVQHRPKFTKQTPQTAEPYYTAFEVGSDYAVLGGISVSWPLPDDSFLKGELYVWPTGTDRKQTQVKLSASLDATDKRMGVDITNVPTDIYDCELLLIYDVEEGGGPDLANNTPPTFSSQISGLPIVTKNNSQDARLVAHVINNNQVQLGGKIDGLTGVEIWQNGAMVSKQAVTAQPDGTLLADLSAEVTGTYQLKPIYKPIIPIDSPVKIGDKTASGVQLSSFAPEISMSHAGSSPDDIVYQCNWSGMPDFASTVLAWGYSDMDLSSGNPGATTHVVKAVIGASGSGSENLPGRGAYPGTDSISPVTLGIGLSADPQGNDSGILGYVKFDAQSQIGLSNSDSDPIVYSWDKKPFLFLEVQQALESIDQKYDVVVAQPSDGSPAKAMLPKKILSQVNCADLSAVGNYVDATYQLGQLDSADPAAVLTQPLSIQTSQLSDDFCAIEIPVDHFSLEAFSMQDQQGGSMWCAKPVFAETAFMSHSVPFQMTASFQLQRDGGGTDNYTVTNIVIGSSGAVFGFAGLWTHFLPSEGKATSLSINCNINGEWIPVFSNTPDERSTASDVFFNGTAMYFGPLPDNVDSFDLEYLDSSLETRPEWRPLAAPNANLSPSKKGLSAKVSGLDVGIYQYRLKLFDADKNLIKEIDDTFTITHGGNAIPVSRQETQFEVVAPKVSQKTDYRQLVTSQTDELTNEVQTRYNKRGKKTQTINPSITVVDEKGVSSTAQPTEQLGYDSDGRVVAHTDANNGVTGHMRNEAGDNIKTVEADGVATGYVQDGFHNPVIREASDGRQWAREFDGNKLQVSETDPLNNTHASERNERKEQIAEVLPSSTTTRTNLDALGHPSQTFMPDGQSIKTISDRNGEPLSIDDGNTKFQATKYYRDFFGNLNSAETVQMTDRSGVPYEIVLDCNMMMLSKKTTGASGKHGSYYPADGTEVPVPDVDIQYIRDAAGNVIYILDNAMEETTLYHYNEKRECIGERFRDGDGMIAQDTAIYMNAMGWMIEVLDSIMQAKYDYDPAGNRRSTIAFMKDDDGNPTQLQIEDWFTYNEAHRTTIDRGNFDTTTGTITLGNGKGTQLGYDDHGRRDAETTKDASGNQHTKKISYDDGDFVSSTTIDGNPAESFTHDADGNRTNRSDGGSQASSEMTYKDSRLSRQQDFGSDGKSQAVTGGIAYDATGNVTAQNIYQPSDNDDWETRFEIKNAYAGFEQLVKTASSGQVYGNPAHGIQPGPTPKTEVTITPDTLGNVNSVQGDISKDEGFRKFAVNPENRIVIKQDGKTKQDSSAFERYFYNPNTKALIARVGNLPPADSPAEARQAFTDYCFDLGYHPVDQHYPPSCPSSYTAPETMSFNDIAQLLFGNTSYGDELAIANNFNNGSDQVYYGRAIQVPPLASTDDYNMVGVYVVANTSAIIGTTYPNEPMPQIKKPHISFWGIFFEALIGIAGVVLDLELGGALTNEMGFVLGHVAGAMIGTLPTNIVQQEVAIGAHMQSKFSLKSLEGAEIAAAMPGPGKGMSTMASIAVEEADQLATQMLEVAFHIQKKLDWGAFVTTLVDAGLTPNGKVDMSATTLGESLIDTLKSVTDVLVDDGIEDLANHRPFNPEVEAANMLGTAVGDEAVYGARAGLSDYREHELNKSIAQANFNHAALSASPYTGNIPQMPNNGLSLSSRMPISAANDLGDHLTHEQRFLAKSITPTTSEQVARQQANDAAQKLSQARAEQDIRSTVDAFTHFAWAHRAAELDVGLLGMSMMGLLDAPSTSNAAKTVNQPVFPKFPWMNKTWEAKTQGNAWDHFMDRHPAISNIWDRTAYTAEQAEDFVLNSPIGGAEHVAEMAVVAGGAKLAAISKGLFGGKMFAAGVFGKGGKEGLEDLSKISFSDDKSTIMHIFRNSEGHLPDTPENRKLIESVANDAKNYLGEDEFGNKWHASIGDDGAQVWVRSRSGVITNAGLNNEPHSFDPYRGLNKNLRPNNN